MQALEVRHLWLIASVDECFESSLYQRSESATEHNLLTEQVGLGLFGKCCFKNACACATDCFGIRQRNCFCFARCILLNSNQRWHSAAFGVCAAHQVAWALWSNHDHVDTLWRLDAIETNVETVSKCNCFALGEVWRNALFINLLLLRVWSKDHDHVGVLCGVSNRHHAQASAFGFGS